MNIALVIPARYGSTRFPGKPLAKIAGRTMLERVVAAGREAAAGHAGVSLLVATEDRRIADYCAGIDAPCVLTSQNCATGSDRVLEAVHKSGMDADFVVNFQGDTPFTPPAILARLFEEIEVKGKALEVVTPVHRLGWEELDRLRDNKVTTPFSGTTVVRNETTGAALWFSKQIIPAIRNEMAMRQSGAECPVLQHIGIYGYRRDVLEEFVTWPLSHYERLEGLEQLRLIESGRRITTVEVAFPHDSIWKKLQGGIDSPADVRRAEALLAETGEPA